MTTLNPDALESLGRQLLDLASALRRGAAPPAPHPPSAVTCDPPEWLVAASAGVKAPVPLQGTPKQVAWADKIRKARLAFVRHRKDARALAVFSIIKDSTWWISAAETPLAELRWPDRHQVEPAG